MPVIKNPVTSFIQRFIKARDIEIDNRDGPKLSAKLFQVTLSVLGHYRKVWPLLSFQMFCERVFYCPVAPPQQCLQLFIELLAHFS